MKLIPLTQGHHAIVDDEDFEEVNQHKWCINKDRSRTIYAARPIKIKMKWILCYMHRQILKAKSGQYVDHRNHDGLDNRKSNIRICTNAQNNHNRKPQPGYSSPYKGASWDRSTRKWRARIRVQGKELHLGLFVNELDAALVYDAAARKHFGEFAYTNFKNGGAPPDAPGWWAWWRGLGARRLAVVLSTSRGRGLEAISNKLVPSSTRQRGPGSPSWGD